MLTCCGLMRLCLCPSRSRRASFRRTVDRIIRRLGFRQSSFRHITRVPQRPAPYAWARPLLSWQATVPFAFRLQVSHQTQEPPSESLPAAPGIPRGASWRTDVRYGGSPGGASLGTAVFHSACDLRRSSLAVERSMRPARSSGTATADSNVTILVRGQSSERDP
jgi:hypothetical protein